MKKAYVFLWSVIGLFALGIFLAIFAAFTVRTVQFSGTAKVRVKFIRDDHEAWPAMVLAAKFETRDANWFETFGGGPHPRTAVVSFDDQDHKHHEFTFTFDRRGHVWLGEVAFPDPSINDLQIESSSLTFKGMDGDRRRYDSNIEAFAMLGPPIIKND